MFVFYATFTDNLSIIDDEFNSFPKIVLLRLRNMTANDATGLHALEFLADKLHNSERDMVPCGMRVQPRRLFSQYQFHKHLGNENICETLKEAIGRAKALIESS